MKVHKIDERTLEWIKISLIEGIGEKTLRAVMLSLKDPFLLYEKNIKELLSILDILIAIFNCRRIKDLSSLLSSEK